MIIDPIKTIIISDSTDATKLLKQVLSRSDYQVIFDGDSLKYLLNTPGLIEPELIIVIADKAEASMLSQLKMIGEQYPLPIVIFSNDDREGVFDEAIDAGISAYVIDGMKEHRILPIIKTALARFKHHQSLQSQIVSLQTDLANRKIIDKAKGLVMAQRQCSEDEAYKLLRTSAMNQNIRLAELSKNLISTAALMS
jgi:response regulator NasT